jgi:hypothetical protein
MTKVWCATIECEHNKNNRCAASEINLSDGHIHTVHQGFKQVWECRTYNMSKESKQLEDRINEWLKQTAEVDNG